MYIYLSKLIKRKAMTSPVEMGGRLYSIRLVCYITSLQKLYDSFVWGTKHDFLVRYQNQMDKKSTTQLQR